MTTDEERQQKGALLLEYVEAQQAVANLREKAARIAVHYVALGEELTRLSKGQRPYKKQQVSDWAETHGLETVIALIDEIEAAEARVVEIARRKAALGLP